MNGQQERQKTVETSKKDEKEINNRNQVYRCPQIYDKNGRPCKAVLFIGEVVRIEIKCRQCKKITVIENLKYKQREITE